jgi:3-hydroxyacyl-CoA dehydrogenase
MNYGIRHVAVIGSGVMGGGIAAHVANAGIPCTLLDIAPNKLTQEEEAKGLTLESPAVRNRIVQSGYKGILKAKPPALFSKNRAPLIRTGNLEDDLDLLKEVDLVVEVVVENLEIKRALFEKILPYVKDTAIISTNTSGIPLKDISAKFSPEVKKRFLGTHFFNPPRWLKVLEVITTQDTEPELARFVCEFGERVLGKGVVVCKDTPNFIANRVAAFDQLFILDYAMNHGYSVEEVDAIAGPLMGRPKTAIFRLNDLVGLDTNYHVIQNLYPDLPHDEDREILRSEKVMRVMKEMVTRGWLGRKTKEGFYKLLKGPGGKKSFEVLDLETIEYRPEEKPELPGLKEAKSVQSLPERLRLLAQKDDKVGRLVWATIANILSYSAKRIPEISDELVSIDRAMKWGYGHDMGPFEIWDALGVPETIERMEKEGIKVAPWVREMLDANIASFYKEEGDKTVYYDVTSKGYKEVEVSPRVILLKSLKAQKRTINENPSASLIDLGYDVACLEFHSKMNALDGYIVEMINFAVTEVEKNFRGLVVGNQGGNFSVGANIFNILMAAKEKQWDLIHQGVMEMHKALNNFRFCSRPVVAAPFGMALGGGAEVCMGADRVCAHGDLFMGLVEVGVGLIPGGGGCKELLRRVVSPVMAKFPSIDPMPFVQRAFEMIAQAKVTTSALEAQEWGFLSEQDRIAMNADHIIHDAKETVLYMDRMGYIPPVPGKVYAVGNKGIAAVQMLLQGMRKAGYITDHDVTVAGHLGHVMCGGALQTPGWVDEQYILDLEREAFVSLCGEPKTQDRIEHMLMTNKPLRN